MANLSNLEYEGFVELDKKFAQMSLDDPDLRKRIRGTVAKVLAAQREQIIRDIAGNLKTDPHSSVRSVRYTLYKKIFGGSLHILQGMKRSGSKAKSKDEYAGHQRGFILRWIDQGAGSQSEPRQIGGRKGKPLQRRENNPIRRQGEYYGNRGWIEARHFFKPRATQSVQQAAEELAEIIDREIVKQLEQ